MLIHNAHILLILATLGWGGNAIAGRLAEGHISPMVLVFVRWSVVLIIALIVRHRQMREAWPIIKQHAKWVIPMALIGFTGFNSLFYFAAQKTTAINLGLIQCAMPIYIMIGSALAFKEHVTLLQAFGVFLSLLGVGLVLSEGNLETLQDIQFNPGDLIMLAACMFYAAYAVGLRTRPKKIDDITLMGYFAAVAWVGSIPFMLLEPLWQTPQLWPSGLMGFALIAYVAIVPSFMSQILFMRGVSIIGSNKAGIYGNLVPIYAAFLGVMLLSETFQLYHFWATVLAAVGIYLVTIKNITFYFPPRAK